MFDNTQLMQDVHLYCIRRFHRAVFLGVALFVMLCNEVFCNLCDAKYEKILYHDVNCL